MRLPPCACPLPLPLPLLLLVAPLGAQDMPRPTQELRLIDRLPRPLAYLAVGADSTEPATAAAAEGEADTPGVAERVLELFDDPALRELGFGGSTTGERESGGGEAGPPLAAWNQLRQLLRISTGELELAVTGLLPRAAAPDLPLMMGRARVGAAGREVLARSLATGELARPLRRVGSHQTYGLNAVSARHPGSSIEVALVGGDLLISNHGASMSEVLERLDGQTLAPSAGTETLTELASYRVLRDRLQLSPGSVFVYLDWRALWPRLSTDLGAVERHLTDALGIAAIQHVLVGVRPTDDGLVTTAVVDQQGGPSGLLAATAPQSVRKLVQQLPPAPGIASLTLSIEPQRLIAAATGATGATGAPGGSGAAGAFGARLIGGCRRAGLDFEAQIAPRLGRSGSCQLVLLEDASGAQATRAAFSVRARSAGAARGLFRDLRGRLRSWPGVSERELDGGVDVLDVALPGVGTASVGVIDDTLVVGLHRDLVPQLTARRKQLGRRGLARHRARTTELLKHLDVKGRVVGLFDCDFGRLRGSDPSRGRHAGVVLLEDGVVRLSMFTPR